MGGESATTSLAELDLISLSKWQRPTLPGSLTATSFRFRLTESMRNTSDGFIYKNFKGKPNSGSLNFGKVSGPAIKPASDVVTYILEMK